MTPSLLTHHHGPVRLSPKAPLHADLMMKSKLNRNTDRSRR
jgi:hypothetical protein